MRTTTVLTMSSVAAVWYSKMNAPTVPTKPSMAAVMTAGKVVRRQKTKIVGMATHADRMPEEM